MFIDTAAIFGYEWKSILCKDEDPGYINVALAVPDKGQRMDAPYDSPKKYLIKCLNEKFQKDFKSSDFHRKIDLIYWLNRNDTTSMTP